MSFAAGGKKRKGKRVNGEEGKGEKRTGVVLSLSPFPRLPFYPFALSSYITGRRNDGSFGHIQYVSKREHVRHLAPGVVVSRMKGFAVHISFLPKLFFAGLLLALSMLTAVAQEASADTSARALPQRVGEFQAQGARRPGALNLDKLSPEDFAVVSTGARDYAAPGGERFHVEMAQTRSTAAAYSLLRYLSAKPKPSSVNLINGLDVVGSTGNNHVRFIKGTTLVDISNLNGQGVANDSSSVAFAKLFADNVEGGAGEIPVLAEHLPDAERVNETTGYAVSLPALQVVAGQRPALEVVSFEGGAEAVTAVYGAARMVIIEFTTPQYASDNDARINARIDELRKQGKPSPSAYRRVGNYSVFVFDAPGEAAAAQLLSGVRYEKDVRWLGQNPHMLERAQKAYYEMTGNTILNTLILTGVSILLCLGVGGLFGGAVFLYRRSQAAATKVYSDAGGMVRLNIDDISPETDPARLLPSRDS